MDFKKFAYNNIFRNYKTYLGFFLSCTFSITIFFSYIVTLFHPSIKNAGIQAGSTMGMSFTITAIVILGFSILFIIYSLSNFMKMRSKEFGTFIILGISDKQLKKLIKLENIIMGALSIIVGILLGLPVSKLFLGTITNKIGIDFNTFYFPQEAILITSVIFLVVFTFIGPAALKSVNKKGIIDLLKGTQKPKKEIKSSKILGLLGLIFLIASYILTVFGIDLGIEGGMFSISVLAILGQFLIFSQFTVLILNNLKKKEHVYKKRTNMLLISNLVYKMSDNSRLLFLTTIVLSATLIGFSTADLVVNHYADSAKEGFPMVYTYISEKNNPKQEIELKAIRSTISKYKPTELNIKLLDDKGNGILNVSNYNKLARHFKVDEIRLDKNEVFLVESIGNGDKYLHQIDGAKEYTVDNKSLKISGTQEKVMLPSYIFQSISVINDEIYSIIDSKYEEKDIYGFDYKGWKDSVEDTNTLKEKHFRLEDINERKSIISTLPDTYLSELQQGLTIQFSAMSIGVVFFIAVISFLYFRLFTDEQIDKVKYDNLSKIGLSYKDMRKIINTEVGSLFLIPFALSCVNVVAVTIMLSKGIGFKLNIGSFTIIPIVFVIYILAFVLIKNKYIKKIWQ